MALTRAMQKRLASTNVEVTGNNETPTTPARNSRDSHSGRNIQTDSRDSTTIFSNEAEGSANIHGNAFSTTTGSHGAQQRNITREDQSSSTGSMSSNTQTAQAANVRETKRKRNAEALGGQEPQGSGLSSETSQDPCGELPGVSSLPPQKSKTRKRRGHGWTRKKTTRANTQRRAAQVGGKRRVEDAEGEEDEARPSKRRRISEEAVAGPSNARSISPEDTVNGTVVKQLQSGNGIASDDLMSSIRGEGSRTARSPSPDHAPAIEDSPAVADDFSWIKMEDEEEDYLWDTPPPYDRNRLMLEIEIESAVMCSHDSARSTPELVTEGEGYRRDENGSVTSTPIRTPRGQSVDVGSFDRSLIIVLPGMIEETAPPEELMVIREEDEDENDDDDSRSFIPDDRRRSRAPSPPSLPPSRPDSRFTTPQRGETDFAGQTFWA